MPLTFCPGVTSPVLHPISDSGPPNVIPEGTATYASLTQASYLAVASQGLNALTTHAAVTQVTYSAVASAGGATVLTRDDPVTL